MKVPLEPIPTEQIVLVKNERPRAQISVSSHSGDGAMKEMEEQRPIIHLDKAYPWLLGASICLSAMLCWMYVTKPVMIQNNQAVADRSIGQSAAINPGDTAVVESAESHQAEPAANQGDLMPSDSSLPGASSDSEHATVAVAMPASSTGISLADARNSGSDQALGWESTNLKVQHILSADSGSGDLEKIVINVPVLYETRSMRWTPDDISIARDVMARLMVYERNLSTLRREGQTILKDWNALLEKTVPGSALRADSPSLPYNHGQGDQSGALPDSSSVIKIEP